MHKAHYDRGPRGRVESHRKKCLGLGKHLSPQKGNMEFTCGERTSRVVGAVCARPGDRRQPAVSGEPCRALGGQAPRGVGSGQTTGTLDTSVKSLDFTAGERCTQNYLGKCPLSSEGLPLLRGAGTGGGFQGGGGCNVSHQADGMGGGGQRVNPRGF